jgi:putative hydrolase of the HAD superfamily
MTPNPQPPHPIRAVLCDFHNTLVRADAWLDLEIYTLPRVVLRALAARGALPAGMVTEALLAAADQAYLAVRHEAKESGVEVDAVEGARRVLAGLGLGRVDPAALAAAVEAAERACLVDSTLIPGVRDALDTLAAQGRRLAVVSSAAYTPFVIWGLEHYGLARDFAVVATSAAAGYYKSDPRLFHWALARLGVPAAAAVHVGDHWRWDVRGAQAAGLRAIWYRAPDLPLHPTNIDPPPDLRPDAIITHMAELPAAVARLEREPV